MTKWILLGRYSTMCGECSSTVLLQALLAPQLLAPLPWPSLCQPYVFLSAGLRHPYAHFPQRPCIQLGTAPGAIAVPSLRTASLDSWGISIWVCLTAV